MSILPVSYLKKNPNKYNQIQLNTDTHFNAIIMDIDDEEMLTEWNTVGLPTPTIQTINRYNNKAHLIWLLNVPVSKKNRKAIKYYKDIVNSIKILIGADKAYQNHQTKNFLNSELYRVTYNDVAYDLGDFQQFIIKNAQYSINFAIESTGSRHIDLFNQLRFYGYKNAKKANLEYLLNLRADKINEMFNEPIKIKYIVKSILKFCEDYKNNFKAATAKRTGAMKLKKIHNLTQEQYKEEVHRRQQQAAQRTQNIKRLRTASKIKVTIDFLLRNRIELTYFNISKQAKLSIATVKRHAKIIRFFTKKNNGIIRSIRVIDFRAEARSSLLLKGYVASAPFMVFYYILPLCKVESQ